MAGIDKPEAPKPARRAQVFSKNSNTIARASIVTGIALVIAFAVMGANINESSYVQGTNVVVNQPVPFSHEHHVAGLGIDCRYCHTSVEQSSFAGMPPTETCMTCHSQIWNDSPMLAPVRESWRTGQPLEWNRVTNLPDFVYFNHSIHVQKGVGCVTCHGQVDQMPLMRKAHAMQMAWCLSCHSEPEKFVRPREEVFNMQYQPPEDQLALGRKLVEEYHIGKDRKLTDCYVCHR
jgi:ferredoxin